MFGIRPVRLEVGARKLNDLDVPAAVSVVPVNLCFRDADLATIPLRVDIRHSERRITLNLYLD